ncbi:MAG: class I SAM-dependent methyltransferase [Acidimicrobiales bacterium]
MTTTEPTTAETAAETTAEPDPSSEATGALADRLFGNALGALDLLTVYLGVRLDLYQVIADRPAITAVELARSADIAPRYAREWLEQQTVSGILACIDRTEAAESRRFFMPAGHELVLTRPDSPASMTPLALAVAGIAHVLPQLVEAYRRGGGVPYAAYGKDLRDGQAGFNRPGFTHELGTNWLPAVDPDLHARLRSGQPGRIADIACGAGWSTIALAQAYPGALVDGFDIDDASIADARRNAAEVGVTDNARFEVGDGSSQPLGSYDLVAVFEAIHDMSAPVTMLTSLRRLVRPGATVLIVDEKTADSFAESEGPIESFLYAASVLHCLPVGMAEQPSAETGTVMRPDTLRRYAAEAGYARVDIVPIEHDLFRFYALR